jgi:hypothetical protein
MRADGTEAVPAPDGLKWVVTSSRWEGWEYTIGLYPADADVDHRGEYRLPFPPRAHFPNGGSLPRWAIAEASFNHSRQLRRASRRAVRAYRRTAGRHSELSTLRKRYS